ncbi:hypothetical protein AS594_07210 [Streptomyces agglomeratus]|uniref:Uncharacterized protein n=1 Tax=Streptomyces agglomeratus TaxID=285458 RepID=A0A1E5P431_9ACTN|nr:hypothetical protein [Streptomyces agglomeratus]OEJ24311.1 hypothetical protein AS594_07210 [Streptomyces agglomeratus]
MNDEIKRPYPRWDANVTVHISLMVTLPNQKPVFLEGMRLQVDRHMYERYSELGELDKWLHWQATDFVMKNSVTTRVAIEVP